jgi:dynein heavy chain
MQSVMPLALLHCCLQIQEALKNDLARFQFEGREIKLDPRAGIFITMVRAASAFLRLP